MYEREFISGDDVTDADIQAYDRGELIAWRRAGDGTMWYKRVAAGETPQEWPTIFTAAVDGANLDGTDDDDADDR